MTTEQAIIIGILLVGMVLVSGCTQVTPPPPRPNITLNDTGSTVQGAENIVEANNLFTFELYSELNEDPGNNGKNIFFSPYSISTALAMTYEGAKGQTADELQAVFHFPDNESEMGPNFAKIFNEINNPSNEYQLSTANALWAEQTYQFLDDYFETVETYYGGKVTNMDFITNSKNSRITINQWVEEQTNDKIKDLLPEGSVDSLTRLVLTNAIYFKGTWVYQFDPDDTHDSEFKITPDNTVQVPMMYLDNDDALFNYAEDDDLQIIELPYEGNDLSMLIILPKEDIESIKAKLTSEKLDEYRSTMTGRNMEVYLPKFKFEAGYSMRNILSGMGMPTAFSDAADFSGMDGSRDLYISGVFHKAFVDVNEEGTEAAAATGVVMGITSVGPMNIFKADHPFIFIIQQKDSGNILFMGRVSDPTA